jgi:hypothetical protein
VPAQQGGGGGACLNVPQESPKHADFKLAGLSPAGERSSFIVVILLQRQQSDESGAPSTTVRSLRELQWSPSPAIAGAEGVCGLAAPKGTFTGDTLVGAISVEKLRQDMKSLLDQAGVSSAITAPEIFVSIAKCLREELVYKPLKLNNVELSQIEGKNPTEPTVTSLIIEPNSDQASSVKFQISASVRAPHPLAGAMNINIKTPFVIARNAKGEPIC